MRYVPTSLNIADAGTRGLTLNEMSPDSLWQLAPQFLSKPDENWPQKFDEVDGEDQQLRKRIMCKLPMPN